MQFAVIGAGNMGSIYGANLARIGEPVVMIDVWEEHVVQMQSAGLRMSGLHGEFTAPVTAATDPASAPKCDVAIICVNSYSTRDAAMAAKQLLADSGFALTLQNGLGHLEILTEVLGEGRVMGGLTFHSADLQGPGRVTHTNEGPTYLGELDNAKSARLETLRDTLDRAGMLPVVVDDILATIWSKFVHNCAINAVCAITGLRPGHIQEVPAVDAFQTHIIEEVLALAGAKGIALPERDFVKTIKAYCATKFHRVSMVQHLDRGRPTEIDSLNGYVARESEKLGLQAPYNDALAMLIKGREHQPAAREAETT
jgi:2-dehydropantoate 2-reductase